MKVRTDFVTNSSSSSFIIAKKFLDEEQVKAIRNHWTLAKKMGMIDEKWDYPWTIKENDKFITGDVFMDNFDMYEFLKTIEVNLNCVYWDEYGFNLNENNMKYLVPKSASKEQDNDEFDWRDYL